MTIKKVDIKMHIIYYRLHVIAKKFDVTTQTIRNWHKSGKFEYYKKLPTGELRIGLPVDEVNIAYCRVSSSKQKTSLVTQSKLIKKYCKNNDINIHEEYDETGSGFNFKRQKFKAVLERAIKGEVINLVVSDTDRFTRVGFEFLEWIIERAGGRVTAINRALDKSKFDYDQLIAFITVFVNSYYGKRRGSRNNSNKED